MKLRLLAAFVLAGATAQASAAEVDSDLPTYERVSGISGNLSSVGSDTLANLTYLHLGGNRIKSDKAKQALKESKKLTQLETLKVF